MPALVTMYDMQQQILQFLPDLQMNQSEASTPATKQMIDEPMQGAMLANNDDLSTTEEPASSQI